MPSSSRRRSCGTAGEELVKLGDLLAKTTADEFAQLEDGVVGDGAADAIAGALASDDAGLCQHTDVLRNVLLAGAERLRQLVDGQGPVAQRVEQAEAHGLTDDPEALRDELDERLRKRVRDRSRLDHEHNYTTTELCSGAE